MEKVARSGILFFALLTPILAQSASTPVDVYDGFESPSISNLWDTSPMEPGAVKIQSTTVRSGHGAAEITLRPGAKFEAGRNGNADSERAELLEARRFVSKEGIPYEFSWSMFVPRNFPIVPVRLVVAQWKQYCPLLSAPCFDDSPVLAVRYINGKILITQDLDHKYIVLYQAKHDLRGQWLDLQFRVSFTRKSTGFVQAWLDGTKVVDYTGITANRETVATGYPPSGHFYFKMGLYRNVMQQSMTIYLDEYRKTELREP